jgi:ribosome-associated protein
MSNDYVSKEIDKIMSDDSLEFPLNLALSAAWILGNFKGINLKIHDVRNVSSLGDFYVIGSATNPTQAQAMADMIQTQLSRHKSPCRSLEGNKSSDWLLLDHGDILVHIFLDNSREVFDLDSLLKDAPIVEIPNEYYHTDEHEGSLKDDDADFF